MDLVDVVLAEYPLAGPFVIEAFATSTRNDNWRVEDASGSRFVLTRHRQRRQVERIAFQLNFQRHLQNCGFPAARIFETRGNVAFVVASDDLPWSLHAYIDGTFYEFDRTDQLLEAARRLSEFHVFAETFEYPEVIVDYAPPIRRWWVDTEEDLEALAELMDRDDVDEEIAYVREIKSSHLDDEPMQNVSSL